MYDFQPLVPLVGAGIGGAIVWATKKWIKRLLDERQARKTHAEELEKRAADADKSESQLLLERSSQIWEEQHAFATDLHGAVKRLSDSNAKKDREIETLRASLTAARDEAFETNHALRTKSRELEDAQEEIERLKARPPPMPFSFEGD